MARTAGFKGAKTDAFCLRRELTKEKKRVPHLAEPVSIDVIEML